MKNNQSADAAIIRVKVVPRSSRNQIAGIEEGVFRIKVTASPVEGRANEALRRILAKRLGVSVGSVEILSGAHSRIKTLRIQGCSQNEILRTLGARHSMHRPVTSRNPKGKA